MLIFLLGVFKGLLIEFLWGNEPLPPSLRHLQNMAIKLLKFRSTGYIFD